MNWVRQAFLVSVLSFFSGFASAAENKILVLGDSLSAAYKIPLDQGWVNLLQERLKQSQGEPQDYSDYVVINASISGATTAAGLARLPALIENHDPKIVVLELGANDGLQGKPLAYIRSNLTRLLKISSKKGAELVILGIRLPPNYGSAYTAPFFAQFGELSEQFDAAYLPFLLDGVAGYEGMMQSDGLHPTAGAQPTIFNNVWSVLEPVIRKVEK